MAEIVDLTLHDWMTRGGDARIVLDPMTGLNRYASAPFPREVLAFASSTANDLSRDADTWLRARFADGAGHLEQGAAYAQCLDDLRGTIRQAYGLKPRHRRILRAFGHRSRICRPAGGGGTQAGRRGQPPARRGRGRLGLRAQRGGTVFRGRDRAWPGRVTVRAGSRASAGDHGRYAGALRKRRGA